MLENYFVKRRGFCVDDVDLEEVLKFCPTPCYLYSSRVIREKYNRLRQAFGEVRTTKDEVRTFGLRTSHFGLRPSHFFEVFYSLKANPNPAIARLLHSLGAHAEVSSVGELKLALDAGFTPPDIVFVGPGKTSDDLTFAVQSRVYAIVAESVAELQLIERIAAEAGRPIGVLLRINTREHAASAAERMVGGPSKFGFDEETVVDQVRPLQFKFARLKGVQVYSASQVLDPGFICAHLDIVLALALRLSSEIGFPLRCIDFGGGFGVPYETGDQELDLARISRHVRKLLIQNPIFGIRDRGNSGRAGSDPNADWRCRKDAGRMQEMQELQELQDRCACRKCNSCILPASPASFLH